MNTYETCRVTLHACQVVATIAIPIIAVIIHEKMKRERIELIKEEEEKRLRKL